MPTPTRRVVLLGASNLQRGLATVLHAAQAAWGEPLDVLAAAGHGRSYGWPSCVLGRSLPAILSCGLWDEWAERPAVPTAALVTDIGNDILYGASVAQIAAWIAEVLTRLQPRCTRVVVTQLPLEALRRVPAWRFYVLRTVLFPRSRLSWREGLARATQLNARVVEIAAGCGAQVVTPRAEWYGLDPIHVRRRSWRSAWREILSGWCDAPPPESARDSWRLWCAVQRQRPLRRAWFGVEQRRAQPARVWATGTQISLY